MITRRLVISSARFLRIPAILGAVAYFLCLARWAFSASGCVHPEFPGSFVIPSILLFLFIRFEGLPFFRGFMGSNVPGYHTGLDRVKGISGWLKVFLPAAVAGVVSFVMFHPTLNGYFMGDDWQILKIAENAGFDSISGAFSNYIGNISLWHSNIRFTNHLTWWLNRFVGGNDPFGYHLFDMILHFGNILLVSLLAVQLTGRFESALWAVFFFAFHPLTAEPVSWLYGRSDLLYTFFQLLTFSFFLRFTETGKWNHYLFSITAAVFAFLSKEFSLMLVPVIVSADIILHSIKIKLRMIVRWLPFVFLEVVYVMSRYLVLPKGGAGVGRGLRGLVGNLILTGEFLRRLVSDVPAYFLLPYILVSL
jgi:hypothetical protein